MMLCEETVSIGHGLVVAEPQTSAKTAREEGVVPSSLSDVVIPKNKAARRRLIADIKENVDKINRGTQFKRSGRPLPSPINRVIRTMR